MKIKDKLVKVNESFSVNMYDNGFVLEIGGQDAEGDWKTAKIVTTSLEEVFNLITEATQMERD